MATQTSREAGSPWQMPFARALAPHWQVSGWRPGKGQRGGECQRVACDNGNAHWFNTTNGEYYCSYCARTFNEVSRRHGEPPLCLPHA